MQKGACRMGPVEGAHRGACRKGPVGGTCRWETHREVLYELGSYEGEPVVVYVGAGICMRGTCRGMC